MTKLRVFQPDEKQWPQVAQAIMYGFAVAEKDGDSSRDYLRPLARRFALADGDHILGGCFSYEFQLALPGGALVPAAGLAGVGIVPAAQGRGGLSLLMEAQLRKSVEQGDIVSVLMASESGLYGRYGYGVSTETAEYRLETSKFVLSEPLQDSGGIELLGDKEHARAVCAEVHRAQRWAGDIQRSEGWWQQVIHAGERSWLGGGPQFVAVHRDADGLADAYALYIVEEIRSEVDDGIARYRLILRELVSLNTNAELAMFQYLCTIAWVRELRWLLAPVDTPIKHYMRDPRQLVQISRKDMMWARVLDMPRLLQQRIYHRCAVLDFSYVDELLPDNSACFRLTVGEGADEPTRVERIATSGDLKLSFGPQQLAQMALGGTRAAYLYQLGEITGPESQMRVLDTLLLTDRAPFNLSKF